MLYETKSKCCGCTACFSACPVQAIEMKPDYEGFLYPQIDNEKCIHCGACERVCPVKHFKEPKTGYLKTIVLRAKDKKVLADSTSGGFITPFVEYVIKNDGIVCGASYSSDFKVEHVIIDSKKLLCKEMEKLRGSKYVQSNLGNVYKRIKNSLDEGQMVCFIGTTCQTTGLATYLGKKYDNLFLIDVVCHGTPSPRLFEKYIEYQEKKYKSCIKSIAFRNKTYGYHSGTMKIVFENGKKYYGSARVDYMLKSFFKEISSRPSCYECKFKTKKRYSDYTIYDAWHAGKMIGKDDDKGYTNVIIHTEKALELLKIINDSYELHEVDGDTAIRYDGIMVTNSARPHPKREEYYKDLNEMDLDKLVEKYIRISKFDYLVEKSKIFFYRLGLTKLISILVK